jgi:hypothetical protein
MTAIQNQVTQYTDIADWFGKALGLVVRRPGRAQEIADKFIQKAQDSFIPVARMIKELKERGLTIMRYVVDPYLQQQLSRSRAGAQIDDRKRGIYRTMADAVKKVDVSPAMRDVAHPCVSLQRHQGRWSGQVHLRPHRLRQAGGG